MRWKPFKKFAVFPVLLLLFVGLFAFLLPVSASSTETTGLLLTNTGTNQGTSVLCGSYTIVCSDNILIVYTNDGVLSRTTPITNSLAIKLQVFNNTHIIVVSCTGGATNYGAITAYFYQPTTGILTQIGTLQLGSVNPNETSNILGLTIIYVNGNIFAICSFSEYYTSTYYYSTKIIKVYPTVSLVSTISNKLSTSANGIYVKSTSILISGQVTNTGYLITYSNVSTNRFRVFSVDFVTPTFSYIGESGVDNTYSTNFVYVFGSSYDSSDTSSWYDVGIIYDNVNVNKDIYPQIIRFNSTLVDYFRSTLSATSSVNTLRCFSVSYTGIWDRTTLLEGDYQYYYFGTSYGAMLCPFTVSGLTTTTPSCTISYAPSIYGDNGVQWFHHYTSSNNIGGLLVSSGVIWQLDYQNNKCVADKWMSLNPAYSYVFGLNPQPLQLIASGTVLRAVCMYSTQYEYNGEIFADGVRAGNGTYTVSSTGLSTNYNIATSGTYGSTSSTGSIINGLITFTMSPRISAYTTIYEGVKVTITINGASQDFIHTFVWTSNVNEDGLQPSTAPTIPPIPNNGNTGDGMGGTSGVNLLNGSTFVGLFITIFFAVFFLVVGGRDGLFAGLMLGIFLSCLFGFFPVYGYILVAVFGALLLFSHVSLGGGLSLGKQGNGNNGE